MNGYTDSTGSVIEGHSEQRWAAVITTRQGSTQMPTLRHRNQINKRNVSQSNNSIYSTNGHDIQRQHESPEKSADVERMVGSWRMTNGYYDFSNFGVNNDDGLADEDDDDDDDDDVYGSDGFVCNLEMSDDQKQATSELYNLKLDLGFSAGDGDGLNLDMTERVRQLNDELLNDPLPADVENRERSIKFKETLVDFISPTPEPDANLYLYYGFTDSEEAFPDVLPQTPRDSAAVERQLDGEVVPETPRQEPRDGTAPNRSAAETQPTLSVSTAPVNRTDRKSESQHAEEVLSDANRYPLNISLPKLAPQHLSSPSTHSKSSLESDTVQELNGNLEPSSTNQSSVSQDPRIPPNGRQYHVGSRALANDARQSEVTELETNKTFDDVTFIEQNGKFRMATSEEMKAVENQRSQSAKASRPNQSATTLYRSQSASSPRLADKPLIHPRPPATPRVPMTDRGYHHRQRGVSARRTLSARGSGSSAPLTSRHDSPERNATQVKEDEERRRKKKDEANAAFRAWLRQKKQEAESKRNREAAQTDQTTNVPPKKDSPRQSFDDWIKRKETQQRREQRLLEAQRNYLASGSSHSQESDRAFRQWLKRKKQESQHRHEQERQRATIYSLVARQSRKSLALARAMSHAQALRFAEYWTQH